MKSNIPLVIASLAVFVACPATGTDKPAPEMVLRTYDVPAAYGPEMTSIIRGVLGPRGEAKNAIGNASLGPGGKLIVAAPEAVQRGVKELVDSLAAKQPPPPPSVSLEVWIVAARPAAKESVPAGLSEIAAALDTVAKAQGPQEFALVERLAMTSMSGEHTKTEGAFANLSQTSTVLGDAVIADVNIDPAGPPYFFSRVQIPAGKLLVLGQSGYTASVPGTPFFEKDQGAAPLAAAGRSLLYVVRARKADAAP